MCTNGSEKWLRHLSVKFRSPREISVDELEEFSPTFVLTVLLNGGLNQVVLLLRFLFEFVFRADVLFPSGLNFMFVLNPLLLGALLYRLFSLLAIILR